MVTMFPAGETVTVVRPGGHDRNGDPLPTAEHDLTNVAVYDARSVESPSGSTVESDYVLLGPLNADLRADDTVYRSTDADREQPLRVQGDVQRWRHPMTGWAAGCQAFLTKREGGLS